MQGADNQSRRVLNGAAVIAFHQQCLALPGWPKAGVAPDGHALDQAPATDDTQVLLWHWVGNNHRFNSLLWDEEDLARRTRVSAEEIAGNKRAIDGYNQARNDATERVDELLLLGLGLVVSVIASLLNGAVAWVLYRAGRRERSMTLVADAKHLATDVITSAAVLIGVALVAVFHSALLDAVVALGAGLNIMWTGFTLIRDSVGGLMDIAPSTEVLQRVEKVLARHRRQGMIDFHAVRVREAGNRRFMELHVLVPAVWSVKKGHDFTEQVIDELVDADSSLRISAHLEPIEDPKSYEDLEDI